MDRLVKNESGMAMALAVIMIALLSVMGAGLLTFAMTDLNSVVETNRGQEAFETTEAGVQAAKRHLLSDADPTRYNDDGADTANSPWAYKDESGADQQKTLTFDGKTINVSIQYLPPVTAPSQPTSDEAPEVIPAGQTELPSGCDYFKVKSYGESGQAKRGVEAIYCASQLDVPTAYYTPKNITIQGSVDISGVSFFAKENITKIGGAVDVDRETSALYGDWDTTKFNPPSDLNTKPRTNSSGQSVEGAGFAAEGSVDNFSGGTRGVYDYDSSTGVKFVRKDDPNSPNEPGTISYPFNPDAKVNLDFLMDEAIRQGNYESSPGDINNTKYPADSNDRTVFFMEGNGDTQFIKFRINRTPLAQGTIIVRNGNLTINNDSNGFNGVIIITGDGTESSPTGKYDNGGSDSVKGFVIADGDMKIYGDVAPFELSEDFTNRPGFYGVNLWSWREVYSAD